MTLGRPAMVSKPVAEARPYPSIIDDEFLLDHPSVVPAQPPEGPPVLAFYTKTLELYAIVDDILTTLYMQNDAIRRGRPRSQRADLENTAMTTVVRLDKALTDWVKSLPPHLRPSRPESLSNDTIRRKAIVCRARYGPNPYYYTVSHRSKRSKGCCMQRFFFSDLHCLYSAYRKPSRMKPIHKLKRACISG